MYRLLLGVGGENKHNKHKQKNLYNISRMDLPQFPYKAGVNMKDIKVTEEGAYSYTKRADGQKTIEFLHQHLGSLKKYSILDGTGNIGGDTILFGLHFKEVQSIEMDEENFKALKHNVELYDLDNVHIHHGDTMKMFDQFPTNILYLDPPWGGPDYKLKKELDLFLGQGDDARRLDLFLRDEVLAAPKRPEYIVLKLPFNYNMFRLKEITAFERIHVLKIRNYRIVLLKVTKPKVTKAKTLKNRSKSRSRSRSRSKTKKLAKMLEVIPNTSSSEW